MTKFYIKPLNRTRVFTVECSGGVLSDLRDVIKEEHEDLYNMLTSDGEINLADVSFTCRNSRVTYSLGTARLPAEDEVTFFASPRKSKGGTDVEKLRAALQLFSTLLLEALVPEEAIEDGPNQPEGEKVLTPTFAIPGVTMETLVEESEDLERQL